MINISVVILHYNNFDMTKKYIDNLQKMNWENINVTFVIVDNNSPDKSGQHLHDYYKNQSEVKVILSKNNLGFAKGNNLGIKYSKEELNASLVIVSNNDIFIDDTNFMQKLKKRYEEEKFDIWGPDIYSTRRKIHQSPIRKTYLNSDELKKMMVAIDKKIKQLNIIKKLGIYDLLSTVKRKVKGKAADDAEGYDSMQKNVVIHGAFFVLSEHYLNVYKDGLYPNTFLYMEEDILAYRASKAKMKVIYDPDFCVQHMEGETSLKKAGNRCSKYIFELKETKKSCQIMLDLLKKEDAN